MGSLFAVSVPTGKSARDAAHLSVLAQGISLSQRNLEKSV